ncbi:MAG: NERD domain-containing protein [Kofleriaceae bacterium]|nr:NERD domain-containing protein [Kofleriaceae bacterium]
MMIPDPPLDYNGSPGEQAVYEALRTLPSHIHVFHSLRWVRTPGSNRVAQGESDFVVFDPARGALVIEVKSGGIRLELGQWYQRNLTTKVENPIQNPVAQADRSRWFLISHFERRLRADAFCPVYHAVWFPSCEFPRHSLPADLHPPMVLDARSLASPADAIDAAFAFGSGAPRNVHLDKNDARSLVDALAPTIYAVPSIRQSVEARERTYVRLTAEQAKVLDFLEDQHRAVVAGAAGTGKTMVALALARRLADAGQNVVFLCFNAPLRAYLEARHHSPRITFYTFDSLAAAYVPEHAGDFVAAKAALVDLLISADAPTFQHVLVDEGQDFEDDWIDALAASTGKTFYVFYDSNQLIQRDHVPRWIERAECRLVLRRNCRTTTQIARFAYRCAPHPIAPGPDTTVGPKPRLYACTTRDDASNRVAALLAELLGEGRYAPDEIALLTLHTTSTSLLGTFDRIGGYSVTDVPRPSAITYSSVRRFKGLEAKVVVVADVGATDLASPLVRSLLYVGSSRAMHELHVVLHDASRDHLTAAARAFLGPGHKANRHALASALGAVWAEESNDDQIMV